MTTETIIVVDDDRDLRESIVEILTDDGFTAIGCETAEAALSATKLHRPQVLIVDNMMPGMGGMSLMPIVKRDYPGVKIIMITAFSTVDNAVAAMKSGADDYLAKPFKRGDLLMAVKRSLEALKFEAQLADPCLDEALSCLSNQIRRQILVTLSSRGKMRFMDITRHLGISDHTKVNFHLKNLRSNNLIAQDQGKAYLLTAQGEKMVGCLGLLSRKFSS
jgi:DNA-binding NtrC family response regulator